MIQQLLLQYKYFALYPFVTIEGPFMTVFSGYLIFTGFFDFWPAFITILLADMTSDIIHYHVGYLGNKSKRFQKYVEKKAFLKKNLTLMKHLWEKHTMKTMFFGKQAYLICGPIVVSAGVLHIGMWRFMLYSTPVSAFQALLFLGIGYYLGNGYLIAKQYVEYPAIIIAVLIIGLWFAYRKIGIYAREKIQEK